MVALTQADLFEQKHAIRKTYGEITMTNTGWLIVCDAHVKTKIKRVFPQVAQHAAKSIVISDNLENCYDLLWFLERYPMKVQELNYLIERANQYSRIQQDIHDVLEYSRPINKYKLALPPFKYQQVAADLAHTVRGLLLADDVGLGKTASSICLLSDPENLPALFVTLTHLTMQMEREIHRFLPHLKTHVLKKGSYYPFEDNQMPDVIICNYSKLHGWADHLAGKIKYVIFDEAQELRAGGSSLKYEAARYIASEASLTLGLSATPIYNYGIEFFNVIDVIKPGVLGSVHEFTREWCANEKQIDDTKAFGMYLRENGIMLRRTRADVGKELPPVQKLPYYIDSDTKVLDQIKGHAIELARIILNANQEYKGQKMRAAEQFNMMMRQATGIAKAPYVAEFVRMIVESGESVVLYGWHRDVYNIWLERLADLNPVMYTGTESLVAKERGKAEFLEQKSKVMIISLRSGAGLDGLQFHPTCSTVVFGELDWSPGVHEQCIGRLARDGQEKNVVAYYLLSETGSDPVISDVLGIKSEQLEGVVDPNAELFEKLEIDTGGIKKLAQNLLARNI